MHRQPLSTPPYLSWPLRSCFGLSKLATPDFSKTVVISQLPFSILLFFISVVFPPFSSERQLGPCARASPSSRAAAQDARSISKMSSISAHHIMISRQSSRIVFCNKSRENKEVQKIQLIVDLIWVQLQNLQMQTRSTDFLQIWWKVRKI